MLPAVTVAGFSGRSKVALTVVVGETPVAFVAGERVLTTALPAASTVTPETGVVGRVLFMSPSAFAVACMIGVVGSPSPLVFVPRPRAQWLVPVVNTVAPLA